MCILFFIVTQQQLAGLPDTTDTDQQLIAGAVAVLAEGYASSGAPVLSAQQSDTASAAAATAEVSLHATAAPVHQVGCYCCFTMSTTTSVARSH